MSKIVITGSNLEEFNTDSFKTVMERNEWPVKPGYWLGRAMDHIISELKVYFKRREGIIEKYALKYEEDSEVVNEKGATVKYKKGDIRTYPAGNKMINPEKNEECRTALNELSEIKIELPVDKIKTSLEDFETWEKDRGLKLSPDERRILIPFFEIE